MQDLIFDTGLVTYKINGGYELTMNPTDVYFVEQIYNAFDSLDKKQVRYQSEIDATRGKKEVFDLARKIDKEMRGTIDGLFETDVCDAIFGKMNVYSLASGLPLWANFMLALIDITDTAFAQEQKKTNPRIAKYTNKYANLK